MNGHFVFSQQICLGETSEERAFTIDFSRTHEVGIWRALRELFVVSKKASRLTVRRVKFRGSEIKFQASLLHSMSH